MSWAEAALRPVGEVRITTLSLAQSIWNVRLDAPPANWLIRVISPSPGTA